MAPIVILLIRRDLVLIVMFPDNGIDPTIPCLQYTKMRPINNEHQVFVCGQLKLNRGSINLARITHAILTVLIHYHDLVVLDSIFSIILYFEVVFEKQRPIKE